jgi:hydrogenase nickel incorporation protein HypA/HybF
MHELGLCEDILRAVLRRAAGRTVIAARVRIGGHPVDPEVINQNVQIAAVGTPAEGIRVEVISQPTALRCRSCGQAADAGDAMALVACRRCGGLDIAAEDETHDVLLESIIVVAPVERVTAAAAAMGGL